MLIVDEVHHLLAGSYREQRAAMNLIKQIIRSSTAGGAGVFVLRAISKSVPRFFVHLGVDLSPMHEA